MVLTNAKNYCKLNKKECEDMPPLTEAQKRAKAKYNSKVTKVSIELYPSDADILQKLQEQENKQKYIKDLIKKDIK